ncbi:hypothetical protein [Microbispora sp. NPDC046933]
MLSDALDTLRGLADLEPPQARERRRNAKIAWFWGTTARTSAL